MGLVFSLIILTAFHASAHLLDLNQLGLGGLDSTSHTAASVWVRIGSIPLRLVLLAVLAQYLFRFHPYFHWARATSEALLQAWAACCSYYVADLLLSTAPLTPALTGLSLLLVAGCLVCALLLPKAAYVAASALLIGLTALVHHAQHISGENNAFTLFGLHGIALILAGIRPTWSQRLLLGIILIPAFGYLFPVAEKLMLNPLGWLDGTTFQAFAAILGYSLSYPISLAGSWLLLLFQASFLLVLIRPQRSAYLYPAAILFHLTAGLTLGFGAVLNPWIVSLALSWAALQSRENTVHV